MRPRAVVSGIGLITCLGNDKASVLQRLRGLESGLSQTCFYDNPDLPVKVVGKPPEFSVEGANWRRWKVPAPYKIESSLLRSLPLHGVYAVCAVQQALQDAGLTRDELGDGATGLYCASAGSPLLLQENLNALRSARGERGNPSGVLASIAGSLNFNLGAWLGIRGTNCGYVSACTSSSHAIGAALDDIALGRQQRAIVIGAEDPVAESLLPFMAMRALSVQSDPREASRPFDARRDGFVGAGGAVVMIIESEELARSRGSDPYATFASWAQSSDGYHKASPHPEGRGIAEAMRLALRRAGIAASDLDYICAHATSTPAGDAAEAKAIEAVLGEDAVARVPVSSIKGLCGHSLSMSGVFEAAVCSMALREKFVVGNANLVEVDPACARLNLPRETEERELTWILNNSSGFGGSNVCHVLERARGSDSEK